VRVLAIDLGERRIGVAVSDPTGTLASPVAVLQRAARGDRSLDHERIADLVGEHGAVRVVVGVPFSLDGSIGPAARAALEEIDQLRAHLAVPVETADERFTTVSASKRLRAAGKTGRQQTEMIDAAAAAVLLQGWLDGPARAAAHHEEH
jgi:putative Holliday junction resolvase